MTFEVCPAVARLLEVTKDSTALEYYMKLPRLRLRLEQNISVEDFCGIMEREMLETAKDIERRDKEVEVGRK